MKLTRFISTTIAIIALCTATAVAQQTEAQSTTEASTSTSTPVIQKSAKQIKRDSIRAHKKVWTSVLGGPSYTPDASLGIGGAVLLSFKMNQEDSVSYRSFLPMGAAITINGTFVLAGSGTFFFNENKFRIYSKYAFRMEPAHFYGVGIEAGETTPRGDNTTAYDNRSFDLYNRFVWEVKPFFFLGPLLDIVYTNSINLSEGVATNEYIVENNPYLKSTNIGLGGVIQYDTRDDIATPYRGVLLSATAKIYDRYFGSTYNYQLLDLEYRQYKQLFHRRSVLAWTTRAQIGFGDIPFTELPYFGSAFDLRGFYSNQYSDKSAGYGIVEYRHSFGSVQAHDAGKFLARFGAVAWVGAGSVGNTPADWTRWKYNYGVGLRYEIQPRKNIRLDIGKAQGIEGVGYYLNMTEAF
ncbi:MAG: BamA/TamA family outer membrane protein [Rikenellaceae bacterium]